MPAINIIPCGRPEYPNGEVVSDESDVRGEPQGEIHTALDTLDRINFDLALEILRMNTAFVAEALGAGCWVLTEETGFRGADQRETH